MFGIAGGLLMAISVAAELVHPVQAPDGTSREPMLHAVYLVAWIVGWALVAAMTTGLASSDATTGRKGAVGGWLVIIGAVAFGVSGIGQLIGVVAGVQLEVMFILFLVGVPLVVVGCLLLGLAMRGSAWLARVLLIGAAAGFAVALLADMDPIHDIGLIGGAVAVAGAGVALLRAARHEPQAA